MIVVYLYKLQQKLKGKKYLSSATVGGGGQTFFGNGRRRRTDFFLSLAGDEEKRKTKYNPNTVFGKTNSFQLVAFRMPRFFHKNNLFKIYIYLKSIHTLYLFLKLSTDN